MRLRAEMDGKYLADDDLDARLLAGMEPLRIAMGTA